QSPTPTASRAAARHPYDLCASTTPHSRRSTPATARRHDRIEPATRPRRNERMRPLTVAKRARVGQGRESGARLGIRVSARVRFLHRALGRWFALEKRDLPWRRSRDPYRIWISEAMLQQTRVETVIPYYRRFLARFPTVRALASAREEDVL